MSPLLERTRGAVMPRIVLAVFLIFLLGSPGWTHPAGAKSVGDRGLELTLSTAKSEYLVGEPVLLRLEFKNTGGEAEKLLLSFNAFEDFCSFHFRDWRGQTFRRTTGVSGPLLGASREQHGFALLPGESRHGYRPVFRGRLPEGGLVFPEPGNYEVWCEFWGWDSTLTSNVVRITVVEPEGDDQRAFEDFSHWSTGMLVASDGLVPWHADEAVDHWTTVIEEWPSSTYAPYALFYLASYERQHGDPGKARDLYERLLAEYEPFAYTEMAEFHLADCYERMGIIDVAERLRAEAVSKYPGSDLADPSMIPHREEPE